MRRGEYSAYLLDSLQHGRDYGLGMLAVISNALTHGRGGRERERDIYIYRYIYMYIYFLGIDAPIIGCMAIGCASTSFVAQLQSLKNAARDVRRIFSLRERHFVPRGYIKELAKHALSVRARSHKDKNTFSDCAPVCAAHLSACCVISSTPGCDRSHVMHCKQVRESLRNTTATLQPSHR